MNNKQLFDSLNNADDKYIIEAIEDFPELGVEKKRGFVGVLKYALPCAACAAVLFAGVTFIGNRVGGFTPFAPNSAETSDSIEVSGAIDDPNDTSALLTEYEEQFRLNEEEARQNRKKIFEEEEKRFEETFVSPGIVYGTPLELPEKDTATFWEGDLPVFPIKNCTNHWNDDDETKQKISLNLSRFSGWSQYALDAERGEAVYAVADGEVTFIGVPGRPVGCDLTVIIKHNDKLYTSYGMLDEDCGIPVSVGDKVTAGQVIGYAGINFYYGRRSKSSADYGTYAYDPLDYLAPRTKYFEEWLNSGLVKPLDNVGDDFEFDNQSHIVSRNEKITPAPCGAPVYAVSGGKVIGEEYYDSDFGLVITIEHEDGIETKYYHLEDYYPHVKYGDIVSAGDIIGHVSDTSFNGVSGLGYCVIDTTYFRDRDYDHKVFGYNKY